MRCRGYAMSWKVTPYSPPRFSERHIISREVDDRLSEPSNEQAAGRRLRSQ